MKTKVIVPKNLCDINAKIITLDVVGSLLYYVQTFFCIFHHNANSEVHTQVV